MGMSSPATDLVQEHILLLYMISMQDRNTLYRPMPLLRNQINIKELVIISTLLTSSVSLQ